MKSDNLFDSKFTFLDAVKILLLIVTGFSTYNVVDIMTPDGPLSWLREWAAVGIVEGAFLGFEFATANAKSKRQVSFATIGFFFSLVVIGLFAGASGLLEFGGKNLIEQPFGTFLSLSLTFGDAVSGAALTVLVVWILALASIYRFYSLNDPDAKKEMARNVLYEEMAKQDTDALGTAYRRAAPVVASNRALANIREKFTGELGEAMMGQTLQDVRETLAEKYQREVELPPTPQQAAAPSLGQRVAKVLQNKADKMFANKPIEADPQMPIIPRRFEAQTQTPAPQEIQDQWLEELAAKNVQFPLDQINAAGVQNTPKGIDKGWKKNIGVENISEEHQNALYSGTAFLVTAKVSLEVDDVRIKKGENLIIYFAPNDRFHVYRPDGTDWILDGDGEGVHYLQYGVWDTPAQETPSLPLAQAGG